MKEIEDQYIFEYLDENDFRKKERSIRKYSKLAYKKLTFNFYPALRVGNFIGEKVSEDESKNTASFELKLPTDERSALVHGDIMLHYTVYYNKKIILLTNITPEEILDEGHRTELKAYKGVMISKENAKRDMFKVNLIDMLGK